MGDQVEVLESIRDLLAGKDIKTSPAENLSVQSDDDEEILDLTMLLNDDGSVTDLGNIEESTNFENPEEEKTMAKDDGQQGQDVLDEIDKLLSGGEPTAKPAVEASVENVFDSFDNAPISAENSEIELATAQAEDDDFALIESAEAFEKVEKVEVADVGGLISEAASSQAKSAISELMSKTGKPAAPLRAHVAPSFRNGDTVEDLVMEGLKPMLKVWLDDNLPSLVEEIVQREISKLIPR